ncbi:hypothetical protein DPMN_001499 [Dreissena polymorpha]|uniref:Uncharacterized protein n=1 Tax=Dreissena polymorpha TaxID=45954 RepID=A0A9D4MKF2_DREPO|nr:hypothetical protein DPMN_001499 [Dreissena polymorpha]
MRPTLLSRHWKSNRTVTPTNAPYITVQALEIHPHSDAYKCALHYCSGTGNPPAQ